MFSERWGQYDKQVGRDKQIDFFFFCNRTWESFKMYFLIFLPTVADLVYGKPEKSQSIVIFTSLFFIQDSSGRALLSYFIQKPL